MEPAATDPWYDYLAFPIAPLLLFFQVFALLASDRRIRLGVALVVIAALVLMLGYVATLDVDGSEGANIGAGVLSLAVLASLAMLPFAGIQEAWNSLRRRRTPGSEP